MHACSSSVSKKSIPSTYREIFRSLIARRNSLQDFLYTFVSAASSGENREKTPAASSGENREKRPGASSGENREKRPGASSGENREKTPAASSGENREKRPAASSGENREKTPAASSGENREKTPAASSGVVLGSKKDFSYRFLHLSIVSVNTTVFQVNPSGELDERVN
jgi:hypothetical protein